MFKAEKISQTGMIKLNGAFEQVFPLFGPVRERDWAEGWDPHILLSGSDNIEEHMVFQTHTHLPGEEGSYTWIVSKYRREQGLVEYTVYAGYRLWWITIVCRQRGEEPVCDAEITYTFVGLNAQGNALNQLALKRMYQHDLRDWETAINHFLKTGERLPHHPPGH